MPTAPILPLASSHTTQTHTDTIATHSVHLSDEFVDVGFPVTKVTALDVVLELARPPAAGGVRQLERPQEVGRLLEVGPRGEDLVHKVLNGEDVVQLERLLDHAVVRERDALLVHLAVSALVDQLTDGLEIRLAGSCKLDQHKAAKKNPGSALTRM